MDEKAFKLSGRQIEVAVNWWASKLTDNSTPQDNGDRSSVGAIGRMMATVLAARVRHTLTVTDIQRFREALAAKLRGASCLYLAAIHVDYGPDRNLMDALRNAGLDSRVADAFPIKTTMSFENEGVQVAEGYGAPFVELLTPEDAA